jgi:hypothetical protein
VCHGGFVTPLLSLSREGPIRSMLRLKPTLDSRQRSQSGPGAAGVGSQCETRNQGDSDRLATAAH